MTTDIALPRTVTPVDLVELQKALASGEKRIGALVYWTNLTDVRIDRALFRQGFRLCGLGKAVAKDPKPEASLNQASAIAMRRQGRDVEPARVELKYKGTEAVYGVLMRRDVGDLRRYIEEAQISVMRDATDPAPIVATEAGAPIDPQRDAIIQSVIDQYNELRGYAHTLEMSETLMRAMALINALSLRTGVYFVPKEALHTIELLRTFLEGNTCAHMTVWEISATDRNLAQARRDAREAFTDRLSELVSEVKTFTEGTSAEDVQMKSVNARVKRFKELDGKVGLWADILGDYQAELRAAIAEAKQKLLGAYLGESEDDSDEIEDAA
jgi:hypothetical protein